MMIKILSALLILALSLPSIIAQTRPNITYVYNGTTTCTWQLSQRSISNSPLKLVSTVGILTLNLSAGVLRVPNAPITSGLFDGSPQQAYPITFINGTRANVTTGSPLTAMTEYLSVLGLLGSGPAYVYLTVADASNYNQGYLTDPAYQWMLDYTGFTLRLNSTSRPSSNVALMSLTTNQQYGERELVESGVFFGGSFVLTQCSTNTFTTTIINNAPVVTPPPNPSAVGDPAFTGFRGQKYQIHGMADTVYSIISDKNIQLNSLFVFLTRGSCPIVNNKPLTNCWSHPGSYFGSLSLQTINGDKLFIQSGTAAQGFLSVNFNGHNMTVTKQKLIGYNSKNEFSPITIQMKSSHQLTLDTGLFKFEMENSDLFINILSVEISNWKVLTTSIKSHGLLGQTWESKKNVITGQVDDYVEANNDLFGNEFMYNKFSPQQ